jgi:succinylglutamate desuccinylase
MATTETSATKISCENLSHDEFLSLITKDFLQFSLSHNIGKVTFEHTFENGTHVVILADGVLAINMNNKSKNAKSIILSCGIHGNETAPIEICNELVHALLNQKVHSPHRLLFIFGNLPSMLIAERFVEENLNRLFTREASSNSLEGARASQLMSFVDSFFAEASDEAQRIHYDLHTAIRPSKNEKFAVYPYLHGKPYSKSQLALLSACGVNTILLSQSPTTTFSYYSSVHHDAHAFTVELGKVMPFGQNDMDKFTEIQATLIQLISKDVAKFADYAECPIEIYTVNQVINKHFDDFTLHFPDDAANFASFKKGEIIASETNAEYRAEFEDEAIVFPNANVAIGQRALLTVIPYEL